MGLTIAANDPFATFVTGEFGGGSIGMKGPLFGVGRGTDGVSTVQFMRNSQNEDVYVRANDAQNALEVAGTRPA